MIDKRKQEYICLKKAIIGIKKDLTQILKAYDNLNEEMKQDLIVDNKIMYHNNLKKIKDNLQNMQSSINSTITSINRKL